MTDGNNTEGQLPGDINGNMFINNEVFKALEQAAEAAKNKGLAQGTILTEESIADLQESVVEAGDTVIGGDLELSAQKKEDPSLLDYYAKNYQMYIITFCNYVDRLSLKGLRRVIKTIAKYPLETETFKHRSEEEKQAFGVGNQVFTAKYMMISLMKLNEAIEQESKALEKEQLTKTESVDQTKQGE